jgi:hypothetical protein
MIPLSIVLAGLSVTCFHLVGRKRPGWNLRRLWSCASPLDNTNLFNGSGSTVVSDPGQGTAPLTQTAVYTLTCSRADGTKVNASVTVNPT